MISTQFNICVTNTVERQSNRRNHKSFDLIRDAHLVDKTGDRRKKKFYDKMSDVQIVIIPRRYTFSTLNKWIIKMEMTIMTHAKTPRLTNDNHITCQWLVNYSQKKKNNNTQKKNYYKHERENNEEKKLLYNFLCLVCAPSNVNNLSCR